MKSEMKPKPGFHVCHSCDPPRLVPNAGFLAHLMEHHVDSLTDIASVTLGEVPR